MYILDESFMIYLQHQEYLTQILAIGFCSVTLGTFPSQHFQFHRLVTSHSHVSYFTTVLAALLLCSTFPRN